MKFLKISFIVTVVLSISALLATPSLYAQGEPFAEPVCSLPAEPAALMPPVSCHNSSSPAIGNVYDTTALVTTDDTQDVVTYCGGVLRVFSHPAGGQGANLQLLWQHCSGVDEGHPTNPTLADIDRNARLDVIIQDKYSNITVYNINPNQDGHGCTGAPLPNPDNAIMWRYLNEFADEIIDNEDLKNVTVAVGDLNGDNTPEVVAHTSKRILVIAGGFMGGQLSWSYPCDQGINQVQMPALADMNNDGLLDVVAICSNRVEVLEMNPGTRDGRSMMSWQGPDNLAFKGSPTIVEDLNNDDIPEILVANTHEAIMLQSQVVDNNVSINPVPLWGTAYRSPEPGVEGSIVTEPVVGDFHINGENKRGVVLITNLRHLIILDLENGMPILQSVIGVLPADAPIVNYLQSIPAMADLNQDGFHEIVTGGYNQLIVFNPTNETIEFPLEEADGLNVSGSGYIDSHPVIADINISNDNRHYEIVFNYNNDDEQANTSVLTTNYSESFHTPLPYPTIKGNVRRTGRAGDLDEDPHTQVNIFKRGDTDVDGRSNITDAIVILEFLFQGRSTLPCMDAADVNDSGRIDISDPIHLLSFLFLADVDHPIEFPEPFQACGRDPTRDRLTCHQGNGACQ